MQRNQIYKKWKSNPSLSWAWPSSAPACSEFFPILILIIFSLHFSKNYRVSNKSGLSCQNPNSTITNTKLYFCGHGCFISCFEPFTSIFLWSKTSFCISYFGPPLPRQHVSARCQIFANPPSPPVSKCQNLVADIINERPLIVYSPFWLSELV